MAFTKIWTAPIAARQDPAAPITTGWGNDTWDNLLHLFEWMGVDYAGTSAPNHNHDGVNSAKVNIFAGLMPNGTFDELSGGLPIGWTAVENTGGTVATSTAANAHGDTVVAITSTVLANGGGTLLQDEFKPVAASREYPFEIYRWASVANVSCAVQLIWYDAAQAQISVVNAVYDTNTATAATLFSGVVTSPANARFVRVKLFGGIPAVGAAVGTVYFDGGFLHEALVSDSVKQSHIASGAVHTAELSTSTATTSTTLLALNFTMTGGQYVFCPQVKSGGGNSVYLYGFSSDIISPATYPCPNTASTAYITAMTIGRSSTYSETATAIWRYINTSPPYDLGDGEIPLFAFAQIDNATGEVISVSLASDPVWVHNGPTNCCPDGYENGKAYQLVRELPVAVAGLSLSEKLAAMRSIPKTKRIITQQQKHADMDLIPHPFIGNDLAGTTVVMLDPVSGVVKQLAALMADGEDVNQIIHDKYLTIGNTALQRHGPAGLLIPSVKWK